MSERIEPSGPNSLRLAAYNGRLRSFEKERLKELALEWEQERAERDKTRLELLAIADRVGRELREKEKRIRLLERAVREACWHAVEGDNDLFCYFCEGRIKDGRPQDERNVAHESACPVIVGFESTPAPDGSLGASQAEVPGGHEPTNASGPHSVGYE